MKDWKMKGHKQDYILIAYAVVLLAVVFGIVFSIVTSLSQKPQQRVKDEPDSVTPVVDNGGFLLPVGYEANATKRLLAKLKANIPLSASDQQAKRTMLSYLPPGKESGIIYETKTIRIDYTNTADQFQVEILTTDIQQAKADANVWFRSQGMSQKGICDYPMVFYLNYEVANKLKKTNLQFNPLPNSC